DTTLLGMVARATPFNDFYRTAHTGKRMLLTLKPMAPANGQANWLLCIMSPEEEVLAQARAFARSNVSMTLLGLLVMAVLAWVLGTRIARPIVSTTKALSVLAEGQISLDNKLNIRTGDELEQIASSVNYLIDNLDRMVAFALEIGRGNLNVPFKKLSHNDVLGEALLNMRSNLETAHEHDMRRKAEEEKERWSNEGIAQFSELLRRNYSNMEEFAHHIITHMVSYTEMDVGGLFLLNADDPNNQFFELSGCFAYDGLKFEQKRIAIGEGLVGRCAKEAETILMTELPEGYIKIATGLGYDDPTCLLLVPMKHNEEVLGVIELASFGQVEPYRIGFVEKIGASMASTISNIKANVHTTQLLEESRIKSEELASQEEEMRQNMEELQATQEEAARKNFEMESFINALNSSSYMVEYDLDGRVLTANKAYLSLVKLSEHDIMGTHHADNLVLSETQKAGYQKFWDDLARGMVKKTTHKLLIDNVEHTFVETYSPIMGEDGLVKRVLKIAHSITDFGLADQQA
ncbi:MAG: GAF domain-containing protein, partial [Bacteroidales bacterium]|nr:GAF domain-containing protein [Bacteroidales bacterium]